MYEKMVLMLEWLESGMKRGNIPLSFKLFEAFCVEMADQTKSRYLEKGDIGIYEDRYIIEDCEVIISTYEKHFPGLNRDEEYQYWGRDIFIFPFSPKTNGDE